MPQKNTIKPELSIQNIGKKKFLPGIILWIIGSIVFSYFFNYSREALRSITFMYDPLIFSEKEYRLYDLFFAALSTSLGFGFSIIFWLSGRNKKIKKRYLQIFAVTYSWVLIFVPLMIISRFGSVLVLILYSLQGYDNQLDFLKSFKLLLVLIPVYIFFAHWNGIKLIFKTKKMFLFSILFSAFLTLYLYKTTATDRNILDKAYYSTNKEYFDYIDFEFLQAEQYGIHFPDSLKKILQKKYAESTTNLVKELKYAFNAENTVSLDTLILEKIAVHNLKTTEQYFLFNIFYEEDDNWFYAYPEQIYSQIKKHDANSIETKILFEILYEQASLFNAPDFDWDKRDSFSQYEKDKAYLKFFLIYYAPNIQDRIAQVIDSLRNQEQYEKYYYLLPEIKNY